MTIEILCNHFLIPVVEKTSIFMDMFPLFKDDSDDHTFSTLVEGCQHFNAVSVYVPSVFRVAGSAPFSRTFPC